MVIKWQRNWKLCLSGKYVISQQNNEKEKNFKISGLGWAQGGLLGNTVLSQYFLWSRELTGVQLSSLISHGQDDHQKSIRIVPGPSWLWKTGQAGGLLNASVPPLQSLQ